MLNATVNKGKVQVGAFSFDYDTSRRELANMIIKHEYPLSMVEHSGFRKFVGSLQPVFKVISRNTLKKDIFKRYEYEKSKIMKLLASNQSRISISTDLWTSNQNMGYMVVTTHFIDNSWRLQSRLNYKVLSIALFIYIFVISFPLKLINTQFI